MKKGKYKTAEYVRKSVQRYDSQFARLTIRIPPAVKAEIESLFTPGETLNKLVNRLILEEINKRTGRAPAGSAPEEEPEEDREELPFPED